MLNTKGESICELCFSPSEASICPNCSRAKRPMYYGSIPPGTSLAGRYVSGLLLSRNSTCTDYLCYDTKNDMRVIITEYFPTQWAHRDSGSVAVNYHSDDSDKLYLDGLNAFRTESEALISLGRNKYLADIIMSFREHGTAYRVMRYYSTRTLEKYMLQIKDKLSPELSVTAACQIAYGLQLIHAAGLTHGDICPENVIICNDGTIKLKGVSGLCRSYSIRSSGFADIVRPAYAAVEMYKKGATTTEESDYYALGALLYYMLTGNELQDSVTRLENGGVDSPIPNASAAVLLVLGRLLSSSPKDRESGYYELLNMASEYGVTPTTAPSSAGSVVRNADLPARGEKAHIKTEVINKRDENDFMDSSSFTEKIPRIDDEEPAEKKHTKKGFAVIISIILVFAAAGAGITIAYMQMNGDLNKKPVNNSVVITANEANTTAQTEKTTAEETTVQNTTSSETQTGETTVESTTKEDETTAQHTTAERTTAERTTTERTTTERTTTERTTTERTTEERTTVERTTVVSTTAERTTAEQTDSQENETRQYSRTDDYQEGEYSVNTSVRIRTSPKNDTSNDNVITLVGSGSRVTVMSVYDTGAENGAYRYWGYVRYQGARYYYDGYVPMSSLSIIA